MKYIYFSLFFFFIINIVGCKKDSTPSWLKIDQVNLSTNTVTEGENTHDITDLWVYMDNQQLGVWALPCEIPILADGKHTFTFFAGINQNGINNTKVIYPFYDRIDVDLNLIKSETTTYTPTFKYKQGVAFVGKEDFEDTGIILQNDNSVDTTSVRIITKTDYPSIVKYGNNCGYIHVSSSDTIAQVFTDISVALPSVDVYMEIDYRNTNTFALGLITPSTIIGPFLGLNAQSSSDIQWKKVYVPLNKIIQDNPASSYDYFFTIDLDEGKTDGDVYLDNIKILYFD